MIQLNVKFHFEVDAKVCIQLREIKHVCLFFIFL